MEEDSSIKSRKQKNKQKQRNKSWINTLQKYTYMFLCYIPMHA